MQGYPPYGVPPETPERRLGQRLRVLAVLLAVAFTVTMAAVVGQRLSEQAMSVLAGAACGVAASIPTSLLVVWVSRRKQEQPAAQVPGAYPPVIVVQTPQTGLPQGQQMGYNMPPYFTPGQREFTVVGGGVEEVRYGSYQ